MTINITTLETTFKQWTNIKRTRHGYAIKCKKGLWGVYAPTEQEALKEAKHYFIQYFHSGEYDE